MVAEHGPQAAYERLSHGDVARETLRPEVRHRLRPIREQATDGVAEAMTWCRVVIPEDPDWPAGISDLTRVVGSSPVCLWALGPAPTPQPATTVTVTGTDVATPYGVWTTDEIATELAVAGRTVVSTGIRGIDGTALRAAAACDAAVAVLPCGLRQLYPQASVDMYRRLAVTGLLLSAWPPDAQASTRRWSANRSLLATVSGGTVVVEAAHGAVAIGTLQRALRFGRRGMVVPGPVTSTVSGGCHQLLRADPRVRAVTSAADIIADLATDPIADRITTHAAMSTGGA
ncbi:DNA-processing protein DprA [Dactylosporangium aurantiacum]|uniref:DNA-processing protein DprA n=1 Tax=Dactylosporangium aurantiacum TaxID=35754 RepID=A0A9Q9ISX3_9ACTN|nr:DNA-processing protein DprA [Dactylosporangium aurantiacum]MDG6104025.1 DNA-processing protein DprA [Dactylosporangium aurantiacum]UWZ58800.1 DNA-processing protein DprA [Dactylosporangium aurantiacum]